MSHTVTGKLNKSANKFQAGEYTGFGVRLGVQYYDRKTKQKEWTNYSAALFASQPAKIKFYEDVLVEGAIISVSGESLKIEEYEGKYTLEIINASLGFAAQGVSANQAAVNAGQKVAQQQSQPQPANQPAPSAPIDDSFDDNIPFN